MDGKVSVIIPVYNCSKNLESCVNSILRQSYQFIEVIMIDDGSTDGSSELCDQIVCCDERVQVIHQENGGTSKARNTGIEHATGKYVYFCDSDDILLPDALRRMVMLMEKYQADLCACGYTRNPEYTEKSGNTDSFIAVRSEAMKLIATDENYGGFVWNKMFLAKKIGNLRFDVNTKFCEDQIFCLKYMEKTDKFIFSPVKIYYYRDNPEGVCNQCNIYHLLDFALSIFDSAIILQNNGVDSKTIDYMMDRVQQMSTQLFMSTFRIKCNRDVFQKKLIRVWGEARRYHKAKVRGLRNQISMKIMCLLFRIGYLT